MKQGMGGQQGRRKETGTMGRHRFRETYSKDKNVYAKMLAILPVSDVGLIAMGSASSDCPERVTQATSGAKSSMWSFSLSRAARETNMGK